QRVPEVACPTRNRCAPSGEGTPFGRRATDAARSTPLRRAWRSNLQRRWLPGFVKRLSRQAPMLPRSYLGENQRMPVASDVNARVRNVLVEALAVDENRVTPTASLQRDLGADSLDLLEILFRLEQELGIEVPRGELFPDSIVSDPPGMGARWQVDTRGFGRT